MRNRTLQLARTAWRYLPWAVWAVAVALAVNLGLGAWTGAESASRYQGPIVPYTVVIKEALMNAGVMSDGATFTYALRSDGSQAKRSEFFKNGKVVAERSLTFAGGEKVLINDALEMRSSTFDPTRDALIGLRSPSTNCEYTMTGELPDEQRVIGEDRVSGHRTAVIQMRNVKFWYAKDLSCAMLRSLATFPDGRSNDQVATLISGREPDSELFNVPAHYREVPPSVLYRMSDAERAAKMDAAYKRRQRR